MENFSEDDYDEDRITTSTVSCDTIRKKINMFLATKEMTLGSFLSACGGINNNSYGRFMKLKGSRSGSDNGMYWGALNFFADRDKAQKLAKKTEKLSGKKRTASSMVDTNSTNVQPPSKVANKENDSPLNEIELPEDLPVYDDCDEIRVKLAQRTQSPGMNQSKMAKAIGLTPAAVTNFLSKKGKQEGAGSTVYVNAYRYFEKERLEKGEPKSANRIRNEAKEPEGFTLKTPSKFEWVFTGRPLDMSAFAM